MKASKHDNKTDAKISEVDGGLRKPQLRRKKLLFEPLSSKGIDRKDKVR